MDLHAQLAPEPGLAAAEPARPPVDRRAFFGGVGRLALGAIAAAGVTPLLSGCDAAAPDVADPKADPSLLVRPTRPLAVEALPLLAPLVPGGVLEDRIRLVSIERCADRHLCVRLVDVRYGGAFELELFRGPSAARPLARTERWELFSYNGGRGDKLSPAHELEVVAQVALLIADNEFKPEAEPVWAATCGFADRQLGG